MQGRPLALATRCVRAGTRPDEATGAIVPPIHPATTFVQRGPGEHAGYTYSRASNPTVAALEARLGALEDALPALAFRSGLAAESALFLTVLAAGSHLILGRTVYGGTVRLAHEVLEGLGVEVTLVDPNDSAALDAALATRPDLVFVESPANPTLELCDLEAVAAATRAAGALFAVDNTFLTAALQRPLELGAHVVVYSTTKWIEGHNGAVGGALVTRDGALRDALERTRKTLGSIQSPFDAWLTLRGLSTLELRLERHSASAALLAERLEGAPGVLAVHYPALSSSPQRAIASRQQRGGGGLIALELEGGAAGFERFAEGLELFSLAESLGAAESLATHPATMTHGDLSAQERAAAGITDGLVRLSVGLEDPEDLWAELTAACRRARRVEVAL